MTTISIPSDVLNSMKIPRSDQEQVLKPELALAFYQGAFSPSTGWEMRDYGPSSDDFYYKIIFIKYKIYCSPLFSAPSYALFSAS